jgi:hypothetical protein
MLTGSLYVADSLESGVAISGYKNSGFVRSLGYEGFDAGFPGFLLWSGSALTGSLTKYGNPYSGVGLELYLNTASYFRYSTTDNEIYVATDNFFFGNPNTAYISGSNGVLEISSSNFLLSSSGDVFANDATFTGTNESSVFTNTTVTITSANSSSYIELRGSGTLGNPYRWGLVLDGSLGGQIVQKVLIDVNIDTPAGGGFVTPSNYAAIGDIKMPVKNNAGSTAIITIASGRTVYITDDFALNTGVLF